jgi:hypothetical protein
MPVAFPSHQGLIMPVWARWPERFNGLALCVGAAAPDIVDALAWPIRGKLGQWLGHSLFGLVVLCLPVGWAVLLFLRWFGKQRAGAWLRSWIAVLDAPSSLRVSERARVLAALLVGAASHIFFDFITHDTFVLLLPWYQSEHFFPRWWAERWASIELFVYDEPYPVGPHLLVWVVLSVVGALWYFRIYARARDRRASAEGTG